MLLPAEFQALATRHAASLEGVLEAVQFAAGERLFAEGDPGDGLYIIDQGQVRLELEREEIDGDSVLGYLDAGSLVGEVAVIDQRPRSASAFANGPVSARRLTRQGLERLVALDPTAGAAVMGALAGVLATKLRATSDRLASEIFVTRDPEIDALVARSVAAQRQLLQIDAGRIEAAIEALAMTAAAAAEEIARDTVAATRIGNVADKTTKNRIASAFLFSQSLAGHPAAGVLARHDERGLTELAAPVGVVFGLIPVTNPGATAIFKTLICLKSRNALIMNFHRSTNRLADMLVGLFQRVLREHGLPPDLVLFVERRNSRRTTELLMRHKDVAFILATGGASLVRAAYSSGKPAIGVGPGNTPTLIAADADIAHAARSIVLSKSFDNGLICGSEHNLIVEERVRASLVAALAEEGAAVLDDAEASRFTRAIVEPGTRQFRGEVVGQDAALIARQVGIKRPFPIRLLVVPTDDATDSNPWAHEKMAPMVSLFTVPDAAAGIALAVTLLEIEGKGHTAIIHARDRDLIMRFGLAMPASRILVNSPGSQGICGATTGLTPSFTLGCGTFGGNSTTDNVSFRHLLNIKRLAEFMPPAAGPAKPD